MAYNITSAWVKDHSQAKEPLGGALRVVYWKERATGVQYRAIWVPREKKFACLTCFSLHSTLEELTGHAEIHLRTRRGYVDNSEKYLGKGNSISNVNIKLERMSDNDSSSDIEDVTEDVINNMQKPDLPMVQLDSDDSQDESESEDIIDDDDDDVNNDESALETPTQREMSVKEKLAMLISNKTSSQNPMLSTPSKHPRKVQKLTLSPSPISDEAIETSSSSPQPPESANSNLFVSTDGEGSDNEGEDGDEVSSDSSEDAFVSADEDVKETAKADKSIRVEPPRKKRALKHENRIGKFMENHPELESAFVEYSKVERPKITQMSLQGAIKRTSNYTNSKPLPSWQRKTLEEKPVVKMEALVGLQEIIATKSVDFVTKLKQDRRRLPKKKASKGGIPADFLQFSRPSDD